MKRYLLLVQLAIVLFCVPSTLQQESRCSCTNGWRSLFCPRCWEACPRTADPLTQFKTIAEEKLFGQPRAIKMIMDALRSRTNTKATTMHFVGQNGVGKSHTALLLAKAYFELDNKRTGMRDGLLWISGKDYRWRKTPAEIEYTREEIRQMIIEHLARCSYGIVVIDEAEVVNAQVLAVLEDFFGDTHPVVTSRDRRTQVSTKNAIFILISDFGKEKVQFGQNWEQVLDFVNHETQTILRHPRLVHLIQHVIPFLPIPNVNCTTKAATLTPVVEDFIHQAIDQLLFDPHPHLASRGVEVVRPVKGNLKQVADEILQRVARTETLCWRNYRGLMQVFDEMVTAEVTRALPPPPSSSSSPSSQSRKSGNVRVYVTIDTPLERGISVTSVDNPTSSSSSSSSTRTSSSSSTQKGKLEL